MESWSFFIALLIGAYLLASIPFGLMISKRVAKLDITKAGSGNIGAANVSREVGLTWGILTLLADALKGFIPVAISLYLLGTSTEMQEALGGSVGLAALLGNQFPIYNRFKGGKGVATSLGIFLAISPISCLFSGIAFLTLVSIFRYISLGSIVGALTMPIWLYSMGHSSLLIIVSAIISLFILVKHIGNIQRLIKGNERRWQIKKSQKSV
jgi:glycerol-3-phosphate acyltransferase PlsY